MPPALETRGATGLENESKYRSGKSAGLYSVPCRQNVNLSQCRLSQITHELNNMTYSYSLGQ